MSAGARQQRGQLPGYMYESLKAAKAHNPGLVLLRGNKAHYQGPNSNRPVKIVRSLTGIRLVWALAGCTTGKQHLRECVPHTITCPISVRCVWCNYNEDEWEAAGKKKIPESEQKLMRLLSKGGWDAKARWQMMLPFWPAPVDFLLKLNQPVVVQADGSCHVEGLYDQSAGQILDSDLRFTVKAVAAGYSVLRVHAVEVNSRMYPAYLSAAIEAAAAGLCIVLSPGYSTTYLFEYGLRKTYAAVLADMLPECRVVTDSVNNTVISPKY